MKHWFPFTDYEFYAYITAGMIVLFSLDYGVNDGAIVLQDSWSFIQIVFVIGTAYIIGHIVAGPASTVLEHWVARRILRPPVAIMMGLGKAGFIEAIFSIATISRYYQPLPQGLRSLIFEGVARSLNKSSEEITDPEEVFQVAFPVAQKTPLTVERMDTFLRLYGFSRNVAMAGFVSTLPLIHRAYTENETPLYGWAAALFLISVVMFSRFLKFYAEFGAEVLRTYASTIGETQDES